MLTVRIPDNTIINLSTYELTPVKGATVHLEHSLYAVAKWESKWEKPFLRVKKPGQQEEPMSQEELNSYIECMCVDEVEDPNIFRVIPADEQEKIAEYMNKKMTATTIKEDPMRKKSGGFSITTAEQIYYLMFKCGIPLECQHWHLQRLLTLIRVCEELDNPRQMSKAEVAKQNRELNRSRLARMNKGRRR